MDALAVIAAAFMATVVIRKLPYVKELVARGVKPFACDACMSSWSSLFWRLYGLEGCTHWSGWAWLVFVRDTAACAAGAFLLLSVFRWVQVRAGAPDLDAPPDTDYSPPEGGL